MLQPVLLVSTFIHPRFYFHRLYMPHKLHIWPCSQTPAHTSYKTTCSKHDANASYLHACYTVPLSTESNATAHPSQ